MEKFKTIFLDEAIEFLDNLTEQAREKSFIISVKLKEALKVMNFLRNWTVQIYGNLKLSIMESSTDYLLSGTQKKKL